MILRISAIGTTRSGAFKELSDDYLERTRRLGRSLGIRDVLLHEAEAPAKLSGAARQTAEADLLLAPHDRAGSLWLLDERGKGLTSREFAQALGQLKDQGVPEVCFLIGGADGHPAALRKEVRNTGGRHLSLGPATWPHLLARVMLAEQLYRAVTIMANHPYHRD